MVHAKSGYVMTGDSQNRKVVSADFETSIKVEGLLVFKDKPRRQNHVAPFLDAARAEKKWGGFFTIPIPYCKCR